MAEYTPIQVFDFGLSADQEMRAQRLHRESIIVDLLAQGPCGPAAFTDEMSAELWANYKRDRNPYRAFAVARTLPERLEVQGRSAVFREWWDASGITAGSRQCGRGTLEEVLQGIASFTMAFDRLDWLVKALRVGDIRQAKAEGKRAGFLHTQNTLALDQDLDRLNLLFDLGMRMMQLTYNSANLVGWGCTDRVDAGLSYFGIQVVRRMNDLGMIVDVGHTGQQSSIDACKVSRAPVVASHTCVKAISGHLRGKDDDTLRAIAATGGIVGIVTLPAFLSSTHIPTVNDFFDHIDYTVNLIGVEHVGIGTDWPLCMPTWLLKEIGQWAEESSFQEWKRAWQPSNWMDTLEGFRDYREFINITRGLVARGYSDDNIKAILGENFLRVLRPYAGNRSLEGEPCGKSRLLEDKAEMTTIQELQIRRTGEKVDVTVCAPPGFFANNPQVVRTDREVVLTFGAQEIDKLRLLNTHHHYHPFSAPHWSVTSDGGYTWVTTDLPPTVGTILDTSYGTPLRDGGMVTMTFPRRHVVPHALIQRGQVGWMPYWSHLPAIKAIPLTDLGPFGSFPFHSMTRTSDGALLAAGYSRSVKDGKGNTTAVFLRSEDEGQSWSYLSHIPNPHPFCWGEPGILAGADGHVLALLRVDWIIMHLQNWERVGSEPVPLELRPPDARDGNYDYFYQVESWDCGRTWSEPVRTTVWGQPPYLLRLQSGAILLVYGHRRSPFSVRAILSRDNGRTWDQQTMRTLKSWDPGNYDLGYPQATQLEDGTILCAYYGYSTGAVEGRLNPCGIFVSLFDEEWLARGD